MLHGCKPEARQPRAPQPPAVQPEAWASSSPDDWPQLVLTNEAQFHNHTALHGASSFLLKSPSGEVWAATARHLIGDAGGVAPEIQVAELDQKIDAWKMFPRTLPESYIEIERVAVHGIGEGRDDWLLLTIKSPQQPLPSTPIAIRPAPVQIGETVYLIGCPYEEEGCKQNVYRGTVKERGDAARFRFDLEIPVDIRGFSGAPIVDVNGHLVGVMTVWFHPRMQGNKFLEAGGEDAAHILDVLQRSRRGS